jgi:glycerol-3-phosphate dehydrogenase
LDAFTNDARLALDTLRSAADHGAGVLSDSGFPGGDRASVWIAELEDAFG